ncbi:MAG: diacylglycerol kinase family lipid kinase [Clostridiales bacterium]|nr:diacylglycerol kinase family lipid kinase [Clostridiales bacterium]
MNKRLMLILNPSAGKGSGVKSLGKVLEILYLGGYLPTVYFTGGEGDATRLVLEQGHLYDCVTCIGGDGTLSETVAGLAQLESPPLLGYIPQGTTNDVASSLKLPKSPAAAARTIAWGKPVSLDVGRFNSENYFTYIAAFGAFTEVSYETPKETKQTLGHLAYVLHAMTQLPKLTSYYTTVECDDEVISGDLVFGSVSNSRSLAGLVKLDTSTQELNDGLFEVILIKTPKSVLEMNEIVKDVLSRNFSGGQVTMLKSKNVRFTFEQPVKWTRDGESGGAHRQVTLENINSAIKIMVN